MDSAVALVQAYLYANGYFTVTEYPVIHEEREGVFGAVTDLDILAVRLPGARRLVPKLRGKRTQPIYDVDPNLAPTDDRIDLLIGEVKEGKAEVNKSARDPRVLKSVLPRFGAARPESIQPVVEDLLRDGEALVGDGPRVRLVAFGSRLSDKKYRPYTTITLGQIVDFMQAIADEHWDVFGHTQFKDPAISFMMVLEKARRFGGGTEGKGTEDKGSEGKGTEGGGGDQHGEAAKPRRRRRRPRKKPASRVDRESPPA